MVDRISVAQIKGEDARWKGRGFDEDSLQLEALFENRGRQLTYDFLRSTGMGDSKNDKPLSIGTIPRITESLSVLYRVPATRRLKLGNDVLDDDEPDVQTFAEITKRMTLDNVWQAVDAKRNLQRQCALVFVESQAHQSVQARVIAPCNIFRMPIASAADCIEEDKAFLLMIRSAPRPEDCIYQLWQREGSGVDAVWHNWIVDERDHLAGEQPYGDTGELPFGELPVMLIYDSLSGGQAYLPIPEGRLDFALNINAIANDVNYLVKLEAHSMKAVITDDKTAARDQVGPDKVWVLPQGSSVSVLGHNPKIADANMTLERCLGMLALSESLPGDYFSSQRAIQTGPALKVAERDLEARRQRQAPLAVNDERRAFKKVRAIHNYFASEWDMDELNNELTLEASFGRQWQPVDAKELQETWFKDIAIGAGSLIGYLQERFNVDRHQAIDIYKQIQADRETYPVAAQQNPAAMIDGPRAALGPGSATKEPGAINPELGTSTEGASTTDAVRSALAS